MNEIHRIWLGGEMPERYRHYGELWQELNPDYSLHDWTEEEIFDQEWTNQAVLDDLYSKSRQPGADLVAYYTHVADVIDYDILYRFGGIYCNTDLYPIRPLNELANFDSNMDGFAYEDDIHLVNMFMHGPKGSKLFERINKLLPRRYFSMPGAFMNATTGVQLIMEAVSGWTGPIITYQRTVFNPIHWSEFNYGTTPETEREFPPETVAVHEWLHRTNQRGQRVLEQ